MSDVAVAPPTTVTASAMVTDTVTHAKRAAYRAPNGFTAILLWPLWAVLDPHTGRPSGPRFMAFAIYAAFLRGHPLPNLTVVMLLATMFGYSMFKEVCARSTFTVQGTDAVAVNVTQSNTTSENIQHTITETRGPAGEALRSLPAVDGATTPGGAS